MTSQAWMCLLRVVCRNGPLVKFRIARQFYLAQYCNPAEALPDWFLQRRADPGDSQEGDVWPAGQCQPGLVRLPSGYRIESTFKSGEALRIIFIHTHINDRHAIPIPIQYAGIALEIQANDECTVSPGIDYWRSFS